MLNHSCILAVDEGNRHEHNGTGSNLARVSTQGQDYERQVVELTDYCQRMNWEVVKVFANKVSGVTRNADREEISGLVEDLEKLDRFAQSVENELNRIVSAGEGSRKDP